MTPQITPDALADQIKDLATCERVLMILAPRSGQGVKFI